MPRRLDLAEVEGADVEQTGETLAGGRGGARVLLDRVEVERSHQGEVARQEARRPHLGPRPAEPQRDDEQNEIPEHQPQKGTAARGVTEASGAERGVLPEVATPPREIPEPAEPQRQGGQDEAEHEAAEESSTRAVEVELAVAEPRVTGEEGVTAHVEHRVPEAQRERDEQRVDDEELDELQHT